MAYASNLQFGERSGLGLRIVDESVGTGDHSFVKKLGVD